MTLTGHLAALEHRTHFWVRCSTFRRAHRAKNRIHFFARCARASGSQVTSLEGHSDLPSLGRCIMGNGPKARIRGKPDPRCANIDRRSRTMRQGWRDLSSRCAECRTTISLQIASAPLVSESNSALSPGIYNDSRDRRHADLGRSRMRCMKLATIPVVLPAGLPRSLLRRRAPRRVAYRPRNTNARP